MMKFEIVVNYQGSEYVKLNEASGQANILDIKQKDLKRVLKLVSTKLKGLGNTLYVLKSNVDKDQTEINEEVVRLRNEKTQLLDELAFKNVIIAELEMKE